MLSPLHYRGHQGELHQKIWEILKKSTITGNNGNIVIPHTIEIIKELRRARTINFIGDDE
jgi:hypothetical protein